jgi:hypothetical protein
MTGASKKKTQKLGEWFEHEGGVAGGASTRSVIYWYIKFQSTNIIIELHVREITKTMSLRKATVQKCAGGEDGCWVFIARKMVDNQQTRYNHATPSWLVMNEINMKLFFVVTMQLTNYEMIRLKNIKKIFWIPRW